MNEVRMSGKVLNAYIAEDSGWYVITMAVVHNHKVNGLDVPSETVIRGYIADNEKAKDVDILTGDKISIKGYIRQDIRISKTGKTRDHLQLYIEEWERLD